MNRVEMYGKICFKSSDYSLIRVACKTGVLDTFRIWGLPKEVELGQSVTIIGELCCKPFEPYGIPKMLGVKVNEVRKGKQQTILTISGNIVKKYPLKYAMDGYPMVNLVVKLDKDTFVSVALTDEIAEAADWWLRVDDEVEVDGFLSNRKFENGKTGKSFVNAEVCAIGINRA